jgi:hypothetical protein
MNKTTDKEKLNKTDIDSTYKGGLPIIDIAKKEDEKE